jgi:predicted XRE-type DNA-binding protein
VSDIVRASEGVVESCGNIFEDLGLDYSPEDMLKVRIAIAITATIKKRKLTQVQVGKIIGESQARVSNLVRGQLDRFSVEKLFLILLALGHDIDIGISEARAEKGELRVRAA